MAVTKTDLNTKLSIKVVTGTDDEGNPKTANRTISSINPEADDAKLLSVGKKLGALQKHSVSSYIRTDSAMLVEE